MSIQTRHAEDVKSFLERLSKGPLTSRDLGDATPANIRKLAVTHEFATCSGRGNAVYAITKAGTAYLEAK